MDVERLMTVVQAAEALGLTRDAIYKAIAAGRLETVRIGRAVLVVKGEDGKPVRREAA